MSKFIDADMLEKDGWNLQRIRQASATEMIYETKKPTDFPAADVVLRVERGHRPSDDLVKVVRCKDCKHSQHWYGDKRRCFLWHEDGIDVFETGYCSYGERKDG